MFGRLVCLLLVGLLVEGQLIRDLDWGELNFVHTTDTHGWLPGHLLEPQFSANWGDYISFTHHMRRRADEKGVDVVVVDTGDRHDGNGLSDATNPDGAISQLIFKHADLDIVTIGNHELYKDEIGEQELDVLATHFGERYLTSNVDIWDEESNEWKSIGGRYRVFTTKNQAYKVVAFGFLFDFNGYSPNTRVTLVEDAVEQDWFVKALEETDVDVFLIAGHIPVRHFPEFETIVNAIRKRHPTTPVQALGGHSHIRDYVMIDKWATALESGRFLETVGWASLTNIDRNGGPNEDLKFSRTYIDFNLNSLTHHSNTTKETFSTTEGEVVSNSIEEYRDFLNLTEHLGCVPHSFYTNKAKYPGPHNIFSLLEEKILPMVESDVRDNTNPRYVMINTGGIRYDLMKGPFTKDTGFIVSPFPSKWMYIPSVPVETAQQLLPLLNRRDRVIVNTQTLDFSDLGLPADRCDDDEEIHGFKFQNQQPLGVEEEDALQLTGGYVTHDDLGTTGDDTPHKPWPYYGVPNVVQASQNVEKDTSEIDVVFNDFMKPFIIAVLEELGVDYDPIELYGGKSVIDLLPFYFTDDKCS
jgi:2',3'-cyclic-nucleotide 2'-phosphodiesterase (5'-nucleotidase family)